MLLYEQGKFLLHWVIYKNINRLKIPEQNNKSEAWLNIMS